MEDKTVKIGQLTDAQDAKSALEIEFDLLRKLQAKISGDPNCRRAHCYGRGVLGLIAVKDKSGWPAVKLLTCDCAKIGKNEFTILTEKIEQSTHQTTELQKLIAKEFDAQHAMIYRHTFFGGLKTAWKYAKVLPKAIREWRSQKEPKP